MSSAVTSDVPGEEPGAMTLFEHLAELRTRIMKCLLAVAIGATIMWFLFPPAFAWLKDVLLSVCASDTQCKVVQTAPTQGLATRMSISGYGGFALAMPVLLWQLWRFIMPGLYPKERRLALPFVLCGVTLFIMGASLSLWTLPRALEWLIGVAGGEFDQFYTPDAFASFTVKMMIAFGVGFEFPVVLVFLQLIGIVTPQTLAKSRRYAIVLIVVFVAILTPSGDPISLAGLSVPMIVFYEGSILIGRFDGRRKRKRELSVEAS